MTDAPREGGAVVEPHPPLLDDEVHVWRASLDAIARHDADLARLAGLLDDAERGRAARFHAELHRRRYVAARGTLRLLLARYVGAAPRDIALGYATHGKPALAGPAALGAGASSLRFNLSHSDDLALFAFARGREVGVDVERARAAVDVEGVATRFFSPSEVAELLALPPAERAAAFTAGWARKEAYLKARGSGLARPLASFSVSLAPCDPVPLGDPEGEGWVIRSLEVGEGVAGALAIERGDGVRVRTFVTGIADVPDRVPGT